MKRTALILCPLIFLLLFNIASFAQDYDPNQPSAFDWLDEPIDSEVGDVGSPFAQGNWGFKLSRNIKFATTSDDFTDYTDLGVRLHSKYFVTDGLGIGLNMSYGNEKAEDESNTQKTNDYSVMGGLIFGKSFGGFNIFVEGWGGIGKEKTTYTSTGSGDSEQTTDILKYRFALGSPIQLGSTAIFLTPRVGYSVREETDPEFSDYKLTTSNIFVNARLEFYMGCAGMFCGYADKGNMDDGRYFQGSNHFVFPTMGKFSLGTEKISFDDGSTSSESENSVTQYEVNITDYQYIIDNLALGLGAGISGSTTETPKDSGNKTTNTTYYVMPMLRFNLPVYGCFNNLFAEVGYGLGKVSSKQEFGSSSTETKYDFNILKGGLGYNFFVHNNFAFNIGVHYQNEKIKTEDDAEFESSGFVGSIGSSIRF